MLVRFPRPEATASVDVSQVRLGDMARRLRDWQAEGERIAELNAELIADLHAGARVEPGPLTARVVMSRDGPKVLLDAVIESASRAVLPLLLLVVAN